MVDPRHYIQNFAVLAGEARSPGRTKFDRAGGEREEGRESEERRERRERTRGERGGRGEERRGEEGTP